MIKYKKEHNYLDFDDVLTIVATSLDKQESARTFIASQYDHILVDEAQDTNPLQWYLLKSFWSNCSLFCVGDDAQSIYSFRGADFNSIHSFIDRVPNAEVYKLTDNYRSTQPIIDLTNWLLKNSPIYYGKELKSARGDGKKPMLISTDNSSQEAEYVVNDILDNIQYRSYSDFLVLGRSGYALKIIEGSCIEKKIPYRILGGFAFMKAAHIRDILAPLNLIVNPKDNLSWTRYLQLWRGFGAVTVSKYITELSKMETINEHINYLEKQNLKNENIVQVLIDIQNHHTNPSQAISLTCKKWKKR